MEESSKFLVHVIYASQTGQSQAIAEEIASSLSQKNITFNLKCISEIKIEDLSMISPIACAVFVSSSTGDGDPPDTAQKFWRLLRRRALEKNLLESLNFTLLGLGDTNYTNFCNFPKNLDRRLRQLGAKLFYPCAWADDQVGLELVVDPWIDGLEMAIDNFKKNQHQNHLTNENNVAPPPKTTPALRAPCKPPDYTYKYNSLIKNFSVDKRLIKPSDAMNDIDIGELKCPAMPQSFLSTSFVQLAEPIRECTCYSTINSFPSQNGPVHEVPIYSATVLTSPLAEKTKIEIILDIREKGLHFVPGQAFSLICPNDENEVDLLLIRLGLDCASHGDCAHQALRLSLTTERKQFKRPPMICEHMSLRDALLWCYDIRTVPKKVFLRLLAEYCSDDSEKRRLLELSSRQGADDYAELIRNQSVSVIDILLSFPSCSPPLERFLEMLPPLLPRAFSAASSELASPGLLRFVFSIVHFPLCKPRCFERLGVATGYLFRHCKKAGFISSSTDNPTTLIDSMTNTLAKLDMSSDSIKVSNEALSRATLKLFQRRLGNFALPNDLQQSVILIGPGAGAAPFIGFLEHRLAQIRQCSDGDVPKLGETWFFFGCRSESLDFIYRDLLYGFIDDGVLTKLVTSFSRDLPASESRDQPTKNRYVQDGVRMHSKDLVRLLCEKNGMVFVCGDATNMARDVAASLNDILISEKGLNEMESANFIKDLRKQKRYLEDVWT